MRYCIRGNFYWIKKFRQAQLPCIAGTLNISSMQSLTVDNKLIFHQWEPVAKIFSFWKVPRSCIRYWIEPLSYCGHHVLCTQLMKLMKSLTDRLPPYQFLIAFSQLISRICHPNSDVFTQLEVRIRDKILTFKFHSAPIIFIMGMRLPIVVFSIGLL